jgi:hypothetical protein
LMSYEEALASDSIAVQWISFAQHAALGTHTYILGMGLGVASHPSGA